MESAYKSSARFKAQLILLSAAFLFAYFNATSQLVKTWVGRDDYSHGFLVPIISIYLVWHMRHRLKAVPVRPSILAGSLITATGIAILIVAQTISAALIQQVSILVTVPGLILLLLDTDYLKALALPTAYLLFMVPVPDLILDMDKVHWPFQLFSAMIAGKMLPLFGVPVFQHAAYLDLPHRTLEVAPACSGVRYLISIIAIGIPLAYFTQKSRSRGLLLIACAVLIGIIANPVRIILIGLWSYAGGEITHGPLHIFQGLFVSAIGFVFLFVAAGYLSRGSAASSDDVTAGNRYANKTSNVSGFNRVWISAFVLLICVGLYLLLLRPYPVPLKSSLEDLPLKIGNWSGEPSDISDAQFSIHGADSELFRIYRNSSGRQIKLQISYVEMQRADKNLLHHKQQVLSVNSKPIELPGRSGSVRIGSTSIGADKNPESVLYWYDLNGHITPDRYDAKLVMAENGLIRGNTNGAFIMISSPSLPEENLQVLADQAEFAQALMPLVRNIL